MARTACIALAHGVLRGGVPARLAELRALTGDDELALADGAAGGAPVQAMAARSTALLSRTVARLGEQPGASPDDLRAMTVGDRERLLLAQVALSFGPTPDLSTVCAACRQPLDLPIDLQDLLVPPPPDARLEHTEVVDGQRVRFRLPTGRDQEAVADLARSDPDAGAQQLVARCLVDAAGADVAQLRPWLAERFLALDPQAETIVEAVCPACGAPARLLVDAAPLLFGQLAGLQRLTADVDRIARVYHWPEAAILALPAARRRRYLDLIDAGWPADG